MRKVSSRRRGLLVAAALSPLGTEALGQGGVPRSPEVAETVTVTAGPEYAGGLLHRLLLGAHYRELWTTPIKVAVLNLAGFAGGLTPLRRGGGGETTSLHLRSSSGREYVFRSVHKQPTRALPAELRQTFVGRTWQDQSSSEFPAGAVVVSPLLEAVGVLHGVPELYVMPDDGRLAEFRRDFAGMLGEIELRPTVELEEGVEFAGAERVVSTQKLWRYLAQDARHRVDSRAFLAARLLDVFVGDWDRTADQWRWARFDEAGFHIWRPVPLDRDRAFSRFDGVVPWLAHYYIPEVVSFGGGYGDLVGLTWLGRELDRRLLTDLEKAVWDSVAGTLQTTLRDSVIDAAVRRLPPEYYIRAGTWLASALKRRRDELRACAARYYALLAGAVDIHGTEAADRAEVDRRADGAVRVQLFRGDRARESAGPYYARTFHASETQEVRLYLHGGDDRVVVRGAWEGEMKVRVISGPGNSELVDSSSGRGHSYLYVGHNTARVVAGPRTAVDRHEFAPPADDPAHYQLRDWGSRWYPRLSAAYTPDLGFALGFGETGTWYGFRADPYRTRISVGAGYAFGAQGVRADFSGDFRDLALGLDGVVRLRGSEIEVVRFYGFGNETTAPRADVYYKLAQEQYLAAPSLVARLSHAGRVSLGPILKYAQTTLSANTLVDSVRPYGVTHFLQYGGAAEVWIDARDQPRAATRGTLLALGGSWYPAAADSKAAFGEAHGEAAAFLSARLPLDPTLALRVAGKRVWGSYPFHEAAYVGGATTVRGFPEHRFAGDAAVSGNAELRLRLARTSLIVPEDIGVFALADGGRVYLRGETSQRWHAGVGGGLWLSLLRRMNTVTVAAVHSVEGTRLYLQTGFAF